MRGLTLLLGSSLIPALLKLPAQAQQPIAYVPVEGVTLSGSLDVANGRASIGTSGVITAGDRTAHVSLARGGEIRLCSTTTAHLSADKSAADAASTALLIALDRGAMEANYTAGKYSDVLMTPDLRILVSGPGQVDLRLRLNAKGDTCVDNHGDNAPYVTVSSQFEGGVYRVQPNQRVLFEHGSLRDVVDNESEPCGCPPAPISIASVGVSGTAPAKPGQPIGGPSSTPADTSFPLAQSEGLAAPPPPPSKPIVPAGEAHAQVSVPLVYDGARAPITPPPASVKPPASAPISTTSSTPPGGTGAASSVAGQPDQPVATAQAPPPAPIGNHNLFRRLGHFFAHMFGR